MFCDWLHRFLISKETQMWCACDIETFRKYIFDLHPQFLAHRFMRSWNLLIEKRYGSFFVHLLFVLSPWKHFRATPETWGSHFVFGGPCVYCIQWHHFFFLFFCLRRDPNTRVNVRLHRTLDWPCPGSRWTRRDELSPSLLTGCGNNAGQAGTGEGQDPQGCAAHLQSGWCPAKVKLGWSKNKKQAVLVRTWGKGTLGHCWWECELCGHHGEHCAGSSKLKIEPQALSLWAFKEDEMAIWKDICTPCSWKCYVHYWRHGNNFHIQWLGNE